MKITAEVASPRPSECIQSQIKDYQEAQKLKHRNEFPHVPPKKAGKLLLIGDSMMKNINVKKIERAYHGEVVCHSISGANVDTLKENMKCVVNKEFLKISSAI